jgi:formylglycine-generating enzyme required for sulfatase activity
VEGCDTVFTINPFFISKYPITLAQFNAFTQSGHYYTLDYWEGLPVKPRGHQPISQTPDKMTNRPAEWVSWYQAVAFCRWFSSYSGYTIRLPTEWEWQQAASGGRFDFIYPWGKDWNSDFASNGDGLGQLVAVGLYPHGASPVGAMDMAGNVYEWCLNQYDQVANCDVSGPENRVTKGGGWGKFTKANEALRIKHRLADNPSGYKTNLDRTDRIRAGFRVVCEQIPQMGEPGL